MKEPRYVKIGDLNLGEIIDRHQHWLRKDCEGWESMCADLRYANLCNVNLCGVDLRSAYLCNANLCNTNLRFANLYCADLAYANLCRARLCNTDLGHANLYCANLCHADLCDADLRDINLRDANLYNADLRNAKGKYIEYIKGKILDKPIIGYKKCSDSVIVTLEIPRGAIVFSINGDKFRTNKAKVISIDGNDRAYSIRSHMSYYVGDEITINNFDCEYNVECSTGIHFFMTREEAKNY